MAELDRPWSDTFVAKSRVERLHSFGSKALSRDTADGGDDVLVDGRAIIFKCRGANIVGRDRVHPAIEKFGDGDLRWLHHRAAIYLRDPLREEAFGFLLSRGRLAGSAPLASDWIGREFDAHAVCRTVWAFAPLDRALHSDSIVLRSQSPRPSRDRQAEGFQGKAASVAHSRGGFSLAAHLRSCPIPINEIVSRRLDYAGELANRADPRRLQPIFQATDRGHRHAALGGEFFLREQCALSCFS